MTEERRFWLKLEAEPSSLEKRLAARLREEFATTDVVFLCAFVFSQEFVDEADRDSRIQFLGSDAVSFLFDTHEGEELKDVDVFLAFKDGVGPPNHVLLQDRSKNIGRQLLLVVASPFSSELEFGLERHRHMAEVGYLSCLFGRAMIVPPLMASFFSINSKAFLNGDVRAGESAHFENATQPFAAVSAVTADIAQNASRKKALSMVGLAARSTDPVASWVYYRAALEQAFGKRYLDNVRKYYKKEPRVREVADEAMSALKTLRDDLVHNAHIGEYSNFNQRVVQCVVLDGIFNKEKSNESLLVGMIAFHDRLQS